MPKTILFLAANPSGTDKLDLKQEVEQVEKELQRLQSREQFEFKQQWATTLEALRHALLDHKPNIIHFSGHGAGQTGIVLEDEAGNRKDVDGETLANFLEPFEIDCVILNACFTALQASSIVQHVDFVIGMNQPIIDEAAIQFAIGFYDGLASGESIPVAFKLGCTNVQATMPKFEEHLKPVLKQRFANPYWLVPIVENQLFTGRQEVLHELQETLHFRNVAALSGLGGMGKTQMAAHYARLHQYEYRAILWCLADTKTELNLGLAAIGRELGLPEVPEQDIMIAAVKDWLQEHNHWLLILDNADEIKLVGELAELAGENRHVVVTTRTQMTEPFAQVVKVNEMSPADGVNFLLHKALDKPRTKDGTIEDYSFIDRSIAEELVNLLGALALDQAGAYVRETLCGLAGYLERYRTHGYELLRERGINQSEHPDPIAVTWLLSLEKVKQANPKAIELLNLCAFLHPDGIPEEVFGDWDVLELDSALRVVLQFSFVWRDADKKLLRIHRLVQEIVRHELGEEQRIWAEKAVLAVNGVFPNPEDVSKWSTCERLLPCALTCAELIEKWKLESEEAIFLLNKIAYYLNDSKADHESAKSLCERTLAINEKVHGKEHPDVASDLNNLALLYDNQGDYKAAKPLYERALAIKEKIYGKEHLSVATSLNNLAGLYYTQSDYEKAKPLYERSLAILEKVHGEEHPFVASNLNNLAALYHNQGDYKAAKPLYKRALAIDEKVYGKEHPSVARDLSNLAGLYRTQGDYETAKPLYELAIKILNKFFEPDHPTVLTISENYALLLEEMKKPKPKKWWRRWF